MLLFRGRRVTAIASGPHHSVALTVGGGLLAFGRNHTGALGTGDTEHRWRPTDVVFAASSKAKVDNMVKRVVQVACGSEHTIALVSNGGVLQVYAAGKRRRPWRAWHAAARHPSMAWNVCLRSEALSRGRFLAF